GLPQVQTVLPYEPYYKLKPPLLELAVEQKPLPENTTLNLLLFPDARETTLAGLKDLGVEILREDPSPFGPVLKVRPPADGSPQSTATEPGTRSIPHEPGSRRRESAQPFDQREVSADSRRRLPGS